MSFSSLILSLTENQPRFVAMVMIRTSYSRWQVEMDLINMLSCQTTGFLKNVAVCALAEVQIPIVSRRNICARSRFFEKIEVMTEFYRTIWTKSAF